MKNRSNLRLVAAACLLVGGFTLQLGLLQAGPGDLDTAFGSGGTVAFSIAGSNDNDYGQNLAIQGDGKILSIGYSYLGPHFALARHNANGTLDTTFGSSGTVYSGFGAPQDYGYAVAVQADSKIVTVGNIVFSYPDSLFLVARFNTDGSLDTTFNGTGFATYDFGGYDVARAVLIQPADQKIVVAGQASTGTGDFGLLRYNTDGSLDTSFGSSGSVVTDFLGKSDDARSLDILPDGRILATGLAQNSVNHIAVARYNADGSLDTTFDGDGKVTTLAGIESQGYAVHALDMGKVLVSGQADDGDDNHFTLVRYNANGSLDTTFNSTGIVLGPVGYGMSSAIQDSGRIVVAGGFYGDNNSDFAVVRFFPDGKLDKNFGIGGRALADFTSTSGNDNGHGVAIQSDGKIVVAGEIYDGSDSDFALARFESLDHQPDNIISGRGNNIYNLSGAGQTKKLVSKKARTVRALLDIQNDGTVSDTFDLQGTKGNRYFKVIYTSGGNVTAPVIAGTFATAALDSGSTQNVQVTVKPVRSRLQKKTRRGKVWLKKSRTLVLTSTSQGDPTKKDVAKVKVQHK